MLIICYETMKKVVYCDIIILIIINNTNKFPIRVYVNKYERALFLEVNDGVEGIK